MLGRSDEANPPLPSREPRFRFDGCRAGEQEDLLPITAQPAWQRDLDCAVSPSNLVGVTYLICWWISDLGYPVYEKIVIMEPSQDDGFKWFGEGLEGFPKRLPEDCVEYIIHVVDENLTTTALLRSRLTEILKAANDSGKKLFKDYIWQRDQFALKIHPDIASQDSETAKPKALKEATAPLHLRGRTNFGDSIADEWLIVYFLLDLSKKFPDAWIRVYDTDGEFLLIEAANALPKWLNPEIAENRVWISNGHLRLIPVDAGSSTQNLTITQALDFIRQKPDKLLISPFVEDEAFHRIRDYPEAITSSLHHALLSIPRKLAHVLHANPSYISPAVEAFYLRDPIAVKPLVTKDISTLKFPPEDFVTVSVKFTKVGFAQLRSQVFSPPPAWTGVIPRIKEPAVEMGMKLTCGFEMLLSDPQNRDKRAVREVDLLLSDIDTGDDSLLDDKEIASWPRTQDDEKWLDIDYNDFENELAGDKGKKNGASGGKGFGDSNAQENLRKMVSRFADFAKDDEAAGMDGIDDDDLDDEKDDSSVSSSGEDKDGSFEEAEFERAMQEMMGMPAADIEKSGLLAEARRLALEDEEEGNGEDEMDEDEETRKVMELMEKELKGHGALNLDAKKKQKQKQGANQSSEDDKLSAKAAGKRKVHFGPERPPGMAVSKQTTVEEEADEEIGPGDVELSSDDEEDNDVDLLLAENMLAAFKGQAGMSGPAGNMMRAMGINMPDDEEEA